MQGGNQGTFRDRIGVNRRNSVFLMLVFLVFVLVLGYVIGYAWIGDPIGALFGLALALVVGTIAGLLSYFAGDKMVLAASRAREIKHEDAPRLFNVVEEMAIAGGLPMPKVYIIQDTAPNAFATGRDPEHAPRAGHTPRAPTPPPTPCAAGRAPEHASVAVTSGLLDKLDRDELQGVIAHEMAHVGNYDIRYAMLVGILVGTTVLISDFFLRGLWFGGGRSREGGGHGQGTMLAAAILLAPLPPLLALRPGRARVRRRPRPRGRRLRAGNNARRRHPPGHPRPALRPPPPAL